MQTVIRDKEGCYLMIKRSTHCEDIIFVNIYALNIEEPKYRKQILTDVKGEIDGNTIIIGVFNTQFTSVDGSYRQKNQ